MKKRDKKEDKPKAIKKTKLAKPESSVPVLAESRIQSNSFLWFHNTFPALRGLLYHVPNGEYRDPRTVGKLTAMGVVAGIPDIVFHYKGRTWFFEFKDQSGEPSETQLAVHSIMREHGFVVWIVRTEQHFQELINSIIANDPHTLQVGSPDVYGLSYKDYKYRHRIFEYLYGHGDDPLKVGDVVDMEDLVDEANRPKFVEFVKEFIKLRMDLREGFKLLLESDYMKLSKAAFVPSIGLELEK
jgi:hypothetical protein